MGVLISFIVGISATAAWGVGSGVVCTFACLLIVCEADRIVSALKRDKK